MKRKQNLNQKYDHPEGKMFHPYDRGRVAYNFEVQNCCSQQLIEKARSEFRSNFPSWEHDPSYNWAEEVKAKRDKK